MNEQLPIPKTAPLGEVLSAVAKAAGLVKRVVKDGKNTHDNYGFASIDGFLEMVRPICAEAGLVITMDEVGIDDFVRKGKYGETSWMRIRWEITVYHTSGQSLPPSSRTVEVLRNGAQAYGSAQSYALKQFLRALLNIATGDKDDADLMAKDDGQIEQGERRPEPRPAPRQERPQPADMSAKADSMIAALKDKGINLTNHPKFTADLQALHAADAQSAARVDAEIDNMKANADLGGDGIPY